LLNINQHVYGFRKIKSSNKYTNSCPSKAEYKYWPLMVQLRRRNDWSKDQSSKP